MEIFTTRECLLQAGETDQVNTFVKIICIEMLFHGNLNVLLYVLYKIINKIYVKTEIAQNDTDMSCIKLDINVSKYFTKAQHFETTLCWAKILLLNALT